MSVRDQRETERREKALAKIVKLYLEWMRACGGSDKEYAKAVGYQYMTAIDIYVILTDEEEFTVIEYVCNHLSEDEDSRIQ